VPFFAITLLAALKSIPGELYESAAIDGAGTWQRFRHVTLPFLAPTIAITVMLRTIWIATFADLIYVMTGGGPGTSTEPIALYTFNSLLQNLRFGYGSALSVIVFTITFGLALGYIRLLGAGLTETRS